MRFKHVAFLLLLIGCGPTRAAAPELERPPTQAAPLPGSSEPPPPPDRWPITLRNASQHPIVLETSDCNGEPGWLELSAGAEPLPLQHECECEDFPEGICPLRVAACYESQYKIVKPGASYTYAWSAERFVVDAEHGCGRRRKLARDRAIEIEVCWLDDVPDRQSRDRSEPHCMTANASLAAPDATLTVTL